MGLASEWFIFLARNAFVRASVDEALKKTLFQKVSIFII